MEELALPGVGGDQVEALAPLYCLQDPVGQLEVDTWVMKHLAGHGGEIGVVLQRNDSSLGVESREKEEVAWPTPVPSPRMSPLAFDEPSTARSSPVACSLLIAKPRRAVWSQRR